MSHTPASSDERGPTCEGVLALANGSGATTFELVFVIAMLMFTIIFLCLIDLRLGFAFVAWRAADQKVDLINRRQKRQNAPGERRRADDVGLA